MSKMITEPEHAMLQLAIKAHCCHTPVNADGFGISWYSPDVGVPGVFKDITPAWNNPNLKQISRAIKSPCFFAHVRAASTGGVNYPNCHPFTYKNLSFMHNGTVPYFKKIKRSMLEFVSDKAYNLIQGTTDSEMMFAMFVTNFERLLGLEEAESTSYVDPCHSQDFSELPYEYTLTKEDHTQDLVAALRITLRQVHRLALEYEYKNNIQNPPSTTLESDDFSSDGASHGTGSPLSATVAIGRLNLAVSDGQSTCTSRYVSSPPETAHTLYYSTGSRYECTKTSCQVLVTPPASPSLLSRPSPVLAPATAPTPTPTPAPAPAPDSTKTRVVVVSSEPLSPGFNCEVVPVNHMVVSGPKGFFEVTSCV